MALVSPTTEEVVRNHLQAFIEHRGLAAILEDYADDASFLAEDRAYTGKAEIGGFFESFAAGLAPDALEHFELRSLRVAARWPTSRGVPAVRCRWARVPSS